MSKYLWLQWYHFNVFISYTAISRFTQIWGSMSPAKGKKSTSKWAPCLSKNILVFFPCFTFLRRNTDGSHFVRLFKLNTLRYASKTYISCRTILVLLSTERSDRCIFIIVATQRIWETSKREGWMCKIGTAFNFVGVYKIYTRAVATSGRSQRSVHFFPFSLYSINFFHPGFTRSGVPQTSD